MSDASYPDLAGTVVMVRASSLAANPQTRASNRFQANETEPGAARAGMHEQARLAEALECAGVKVIMFEPPAASHSPDGVFPNNWFSTHENGRLVLYPMEAPSRRTERIPDLAERLRTGGFRVDDVLDLAGHGNEPRFLEGTGSLVLDRANRVAYAAPSTRTDPGLAEDWARQLGYRLVLFAAADPSGRPVYHTNVIMSLGAGVAIVCLEAVPDDSDRRRLVESLEEDGRQIVEISWQQVCAFAGNQLFMRGASGPVVALSESAHASLDMRQKKIIDRHAQRVVADIATIERHGGGSVRCMLAEIFLPRTTQLRGGLHDGPKPAG